MANEKVRDVMTPDPMACPASTTVAQAARLMRDQGIGDVLIETNGEIHGIVTDRDLVIRALADDLDPKTTTLRDVASTDLVTLSPDDDIQDAARLMRDKAIRRLPVCEGGKPVGIVSLGDLAIDLDGKSVLAEISQASPDR